MGLLAKDSHQALLRHFSSISNTMKSQNFLYLFLHIKHVEICIFTQGRVVQCSPMDVQEIEDHITASFMRFGCSFWAYVLKPNLSKHYYYLWAGCEIFTAGVAIMKRYSFNSECTRFEYFRGFQSLTHRIQLVQFHRNVVK